MCKALLLNGLNIERCSKQTNDELCSKHLNKHKFRTDECAICMQEMKDEIPLNCGHWFHRQCLFTCRKCPLCRKQINIDDLSYIKGTNIIVKNVSVFNGIDKSTMCMMLKDLFRNLHDTQHYNCDNYMYSNNYMKDLTKYVNYIVDEFCYHFNINFDIFIDLIHNTQMNIKYQNALMFCFNVKLMNYEDDMINKLISFVIEKIFNEMRFEFETMNM